MRVALVVFLVLHGAAHLFAFSTRGALSLVAPRPTAIGGLLNMGPAGFTTYRSAWVVASLAFMVVAVGVWLGAAWTGVALVAVTGLSLGLCLLGMPDAVRGVVANLALMVWLATRPGLLFTGVAR